MASTGNVETLDKDSETQWVTTIGPLRLSLTGVFGSGTAKLQARTPEGTIVDVAEGSFTAATDTIFDFPARSETDVRVKLTGSSSPLLVVWLQGNAAYH